MRPPYRRPKLRKDTKGVSEIIGTMLILSMTVVLFSVIIIWVNSFPSSSDLVWMIGLIFLMVKSLRASGRSISSSSFFTGSASLEETVFPL